MDTQFSQPRDSMRYVRRELTFSAEPNSYPSRLQRLRSFNYGVRVPTATSKFDKQHIKGYEHPRKRNRTHHGRFHSGSAVGEHSNSCKKFAPVKPTETKLKIETSGEDCQQVQTNVVKNSLSAGETENSSGDIDIVQDRENIEENILRRLDRKEEKEFNKTLVEQVVSKIQVN